MTPPKLVCELASSPEQDTNQPHIFAGFKLSPFSWKKRKIRWHFKETAEFTRMPITKEQIIRETRLVMRNWRKWSALRINLVPERNEAEADIVIQFADTPPKSYSDGQWKGGVLAIGYHPFSQTNTIAGDIYINSKNYEWASWRLLQQIGADIKGSWYDYYSMMVHEVGHAIGISHSDVRSSVMYWSYQRRTEPFHLDPDDKKAVIAIYKKNTTWSQRLWDRLRQESPNPDW